MLVTLVVLSLLAAFVHGLPFHSSMHSLISRQDTIVPSDIPAACRTKCTPFINTLNDCASSPDVTCGCTTSTKRMLDTCHDCLIDLLPSSKPGWDSNEQAFYDLCADAGKPIPGVSTDDLSSTRSSPTGSSPPTSSNTNDAITASRHIWLIIMGALALGVFGI